MQIPEKGTIYDNNYEVIGALGQGGFASACLAKDLKTGEKVVLKFPDINQLGDPAVYERFKREIAIGSLLNHPDLPIAFAYSEGNPPYIVVRYSDGKPLTDIIKEKGKFTAEETIDMVSKLLEVLQYCHEKGVYHRDIKPENLLLGSDGHLKLIDFGIAGMEGAPRVTYRGFSNLVGTPEYMSPEQIKGERGGAKSDIYAVGCVMYNFLAGNPPYSGDNPLAIMYQHMTAEVVPLTQICTDVSKPLWAVIKKSLRRRKEERYDSAIEMANDLRNLDKVDLSILDKADPPLSSVATAKKSSWIIVVAISIVILIIVVLIFALKK